ncbi:MAG: MinD/ParA family protein [Candidatus Riflebacteria bacterium]|nr:MinD/ParA family protein [Candidatus Riflebacteria bacterium]
MGHIITIHSFRGGTGKSNVCANLAAVLARAGKRVAIIDTDVQSPGVHLLFGFEPGELNLTLNDYLKETCSIQECAYDASARIPVETGKVFVVPSSLQYLEIARILKSGFDLDLMLDGFRQAIDRLALDFLIVDTHPGLKEETMLFTVMSHLLLVLLRPDQQDYLGTGVVVEVARRLGVPKIGLVVNKLLPTYDPRTVRERMNAAYGCEVLEILPLDHGVLELESGCVTVIRRPELPFSQAMVRLGDRVLAQLK